MVVHSQKESEISCVVKGMERGCWIYVLELGLVIEFLILILLALE